jgi:F420-dependent oxidoreductase-like protein
MRIGITVGIGERAEESIDGLVARAAEIEGAGLATMWMPVAFGMDPMTALAVAGRATSRIECGTAIVPAFPRHPVAMAQQARTTQAALGGRFTLGIGVSHEVMMSDALGLPFDRPASRLREYLSVLMPLLEGDAVAFRGEHYGVDVAISVDSPPVPVLVAALGPRMLRVAGELTTGTMTAWVGARTLASHVVPTITAAADAAGRPRPRIAAGLPIALTNDPAAARDHVTARSGRYGSLPAFRAMFDREGVRGPADVALVGDEAVLDAELDRLEEAGATDFVAQIQLVDPSAGRRTFDYLVARAQRAGGPGVIAPTPDRR